MALLLSSTTNAGQRRQEGETPLSAVTPFLQHSSEEVELPDDTVVVG